MKCAISSSVGDRSSIQIGLEQMNCRGLTDHLWRDPSLCPGGALLQFHRQYESLVSIDSRHRVRCDLQQWQCSSVLRI